MRWHANQVGTARSFARIALAVSIALAHAGAAHATATLLCEVDDANLSLDLIGSIGSLPGSPLVGARGSLAIKAAPDWLAIAVSIESKNLTQQWIDMPDDLRLRLQVIGNDRAGEIDIAITTRRASPDNFHGRYRLTMRRRGKEREASGDVNCSFG
jgi:hypothetical protein